MLKSIIPAATAAILLATPADAALWLVTGTGVLAQSPALGSETRLDGVPFDNQAFVFGLVIDDSVVPFDNSPPGGTGQSRTYPGAAIGFGLAIGGYSVTRTPASVGSMFLLNDAGVAPTVRLDQLSVSEGFFFTPDGFAPHLETDAPLPENGFISGFNFGRSVTTTAPAVPDLLTSAELPPLDQIWRPAPGQMFLTLNVRAGTPTTPAELSRLPHARFSARELFFTVERLPDVGAVPEPASWALMIAGFGFVGGVLRGRRAVAA